MPPSKADRLSEQEVLSVRHWIEGGARAIQEPVAALNQHDIIPILLRRCAAWSEANEQRSSRRGDFFTGGRVEAEHAAVRLMEGGAVTVRPRTPEAFPA